MRLYVRMLEITYVRMYVLTYTYSSSMYLIINTIRRVCTDDTKGADANNELTVP